MARRWAKMSRADLAERVGVSKGAAAQWEHPHGTNPTLENLVSAAEAMGVSFEWLATGAGLPHPQDREILAASLSEFAHDYSESELLLLWRQLVPRAREHLLGLLTAIGPRVRTRR